MDTKLNETSLNINTDHFSQYKLLLPEELTQRKPVHILRLNTHKIIQ